MAAPSKPGTPVLETTPNQTLPTPKRRWFDKYVGVLTSNEAQQLADVASELRGRKIDIDRE
jgi:hypothetical protein